MPLLLAVWLVTALLYYATKDARLDMELARHGQVSPRLQAKYGAAAAETTSRYGMTDYFKDAWSDVWQGRRDALHAAREAGEHVSWRERFGAARRRVEERAAEKTRKHRNHEKVPSADDEPLVDDPFFDRPHAEPDTPEQAETVEDTTHWGPFDAPGPDTIPDPPPADSEPVHVPNTQGEPIREPATPPEPAAAPHAGPQPDTQGEPAVTAAAVVATREVTGTTSGAEEARRILSHVAHAANTHHRELANIANRIDRLAQACAAEIQLARNAAVMGALTQSLEATAAAQAATNGAAAELAACIEVVRRAFVRLSS